MSLFTGGIATAIALGASTGGSIVAAKAQSGAAKKAAEIQATSSGKALDFAKQQDAMDREENRNATRANYEQYTASEKQKAPYRGVGQAATQTIGHLLGFSPESMAVAPPPSLPTYLQEPTPPTSAARTVQPRADMVKVQAPNGQVKDMTAGEAQYYVQRGARIV